MATTRRKPATRSRKAPAKQSTKRSPFGFLIFGLILGLALAAFLSYYLKSSPLPFTQQTAQTSNQTSTGMRQTVPASQQPPLQAPTRNVEAPAVVQTAPGYVSPQPATTSPGSATTSSAPSTSIAAQTANNQGTQQPSASSTADPIGAIIDPNSGLVTAPVAQSNARINPDALIKQKPETAKSPSTTVNGNAGTTASSNANTTVSQTAKTSSTPAAASSTKSKTTTGSSDQIAQLIKNIPEERKSPTISQNLASAPLRIQAPSSIAATDKGVHLNTAPANANKPASNSNKATTGASASSNSTASGANNSASAKKISTQYLQVGSFANYQEADATRARMLLLGFNNVSISKTRVNNTEFNRVRIGPFNDEQALKTSQQKLQSANIQSTVVR